MGNRRTAKVAEAIREVVSSAILFELRDPRIKSVTVLGVEVPTDLRSAKVFVSVLGDEAQQRLSMKGLSAARGFLQSKVADRVNLRFTPILSFELDDGVKKSIEASRILRELAEERAARDREEHLASEAETLDVDPPESGPVSPALSPERHDFPDSACDRGDAS